MTKGNKIRKQSKYRHNYNLHFHPLNIPDKNNISLNSKNTFTHYL